MQTGKQTSRTYEGRHPTRRHLGGHAVHMKACIRHTDPQTGMQDVYRQASAGMQTGRQTSQTQAHRHMNENERLK